MKAILIILSLCFSSIILRAQNVNVVNFSPLPNDLTANTAGTEVLDQNGEKAALVRIQTTQTGFSFDAGMMGVVKTIQKIGEIWLYIPKGSKRITLRHQQLGTCEFIYPCAIEAARTYEMQLASGIVQTVVTNDAGGNFLIMKVLPENASVYVDGNLQQNDAKGEYSVFLSYGEHSYRVEAAGFSTESGIANIGKETNTLNVKLESSLAELSIACPTNGAKIYVNKQFKGTNSWNGKVPAGRYLVEASKDGYRNLLETIMLSEKESKTITMPSLEPIYGMLKVNVKPIGSIVEIDGNVVGKTPTILDNVIVGRHSVKIKAPNGVELVKQIVIKEGEICEVEDVIPEYTLKQLDSIANSTGDYTMALKVAVESAEKGDAFAQNLLGNYYYNGNGVSQDYSKAVEWYRKAAEQGYAAAKYNLGVCYYNGNGVSQDYSKAVEWYRKAAEQGYAAAQCDLGDCYFNGKGVSRDYSKAVEWYRKAAEQGYAEAQCNLGWCYKVGVGVSQDYSKAVEWFRKAAEQGYAEAQYRLAKCYYDGHGVAIDKQKAKEWLEKSAKSGNEVAQKILKEKF